MRSRGVASDPLYDWSESQGEHVAQAPGSAAAEAPAPESHPARLAHRTLQAVRTARVQVCARCRPWPEGLPVGQRPERAAGHGLRAAGASQQDRAVGRRLPADAGTPRRGRCDQPRAAATAGADRLKAHGERRARRHPDRRPAGREHAAVLDRFRARGLCARRRCRCVRHPPGTERGRR